MIIPLVSVKRGVTQVAWGLFVLSTWPSILIMLAFLFLGLLGSRRAGSTRKVITSRRNSWS